MSHQTIETLKTIYQTDRDASMRLKYIGDACTSYVKAAADTENAWQSMALQLSREDLAPFKKELDNNLDLALANVRDALEHGNRLAAAKDQPALFDGALSDKKALAAYALELCLAYYETRA